MAVVKAAEEGRGIEDFRKDFAALVQKHGWHGWTGEGTPGGEAWRTRVIYQTNMAASYAAGRWAQINDPGLADFRPYIKYHHADGVQHPRPLHVSWNGLVLPKDHPFWQTHAPPNGWGCHCYVSAAGPKDYAHAQAAGKTAPPAGWDSNAGIDNGWAYNPGANTLTPLREMVADKLITFPPAITRALSHDLNRYALAHESPSAFAAAVLSDREIRNSVAWLGFVEDAAVLEASTGHDLRGFMGIIPADAPRHIERAHRYDGDGQRPVVAGDYDQVWRVLNEADSVESGHATVRELASIVVHKEIGAETYRAVYEIRPGKKNRSLALVSLVIKTK